MTFGWRIVPYGQQPGREEFRCSVEELDHYLRANAAQQVRRGLIALMVCEEPVSKRIVGYYTLSSYKIVTDSLPADARKGLPTFVPATLLGRLAVDTEYQGQRLGATLLTHAMKRSADAAEVMASYALVVDAKDDVAKSFYRHFGFREFADVPLRLFIPMRQLRVAR